MEHNLEELGDWNRLAAFSEAKAMEISRLREKIMNLRYVYEIPEGTKFRGTDSRAGFLEKQWNGGLT